MANAKKFSLVGLLSRVFGRPEKRPWYSRLAYQYWGRNYHFREDYTFGTLFFVGKCPECNQDIVIDPKRHRISQGILGVTFSPSLVCPHEPCGWHVMLENGFARDCDQRYVPRGARPLRPLPDRPYRYNRNAGIPARDQTRPSRRDDSPPRHHGHSLQ
jgi:hypothetical protein